MGHVEPGVIFQSQTDSLLCGAKATFLITYERVQAHVCVFAILLKHMVAVMGNDFRVFAVGHDGQVGLPEYGG